MNPGLPPCKGGALPLSYGPALALVVVPLWMEVFYLRPSDRYPPRETVTCDGITRARTGPRVGAVAIDVEMSRGRRATDHPTHRAPGTAEWEPRVFHSVDTAYVFHAGGRSSSETGDAGLAVR